MFSRVLNLMFIVSAYVLSNFMDTSAQAPSNVITLDPTTTYQTITGWEATDWMAQDGVASYEIRNVDKWKDTVGVLAAEVGVNRLRLDFQSGAENPVDYNTPYYNEQISRLQWSDHWYEIINDNNDPNVIDWNGFQFTHLDYDIEKAVLPLKQQLEAKGETLYIMLTYGHNITPDFNYSPLHRDNPEEYAECMLATFLHLQSKYGWVPDAIDVLNEPQGLSGWNGFQIGNVLVAAAQRLAANGFNPDFIAPSGVTMSTTINLFDQMIQVAGVSSYLTEISYHLYGWGPDATLQAIADLATQYGLNTSMTEWWDTANTYHRLHKDLKLGRNSSWQKGVLAGRDPTPNSTAKMFVINTSDPANPQVLMNHPTKYVRQYFKFVRKGAIRIDAASTSSNFDPLAFLNTDGKYVVVVKAAAGGSFVIQGLPASTYGIKYTTGDGANAPIQYDVDLADAVISTGQAVDTSIPASGVITVYAKSSTPVPVELSSFSAEVQGRDVILTWVTQSETNNFGFEVQVERSQNGNEFLDIGFIQGNGTTSVPNEYRFIDKNLTQGKYYYRLKQIDTDGGFEFSGTVEAVIELPKDFLLYQNHPNPFNAVTTIEYGLPKMSRVKLVIIDLLGKEIIKLVDTMQESGSYRVQWDASQVGSGIYLYKLQAGSFIEVKKMLLIK